MTYNSETPKAVHRQLEAAACTTRYPVDAFLFVLLAFPQHGVSEVEENHISAKELCWRLHDQAIAQFGGNAREQLDEWAIRSCRDFGNIVYAMVDASLIARNERDSPEDFKYVFDFEDAFLEYFRPQTVGHQFRWRLATMFLITTVAAIAFTGFASSGFRGAVLILCFSWTALWGTSCLILGVSQRRVLVIAGGATLTLIGIVGFLLVADPLLQ